MDRVLVPIYPYSLGETVRFLIAHRILTFVAMEIDQVNTIAIVGAGTMGSGIAQVAAQAGFEVILYDIKQEVLDKANVRIGANLDGAIKRQKITEGEKTATLQRIHFTTDFSRVVAELIIEAVIEKEDLKHNIFRDLAAQNSDNTILASNTSSIPITRLASPIPHPERVVGMHFFNPVHIMKLVEVIKGMATVPEVALTVKTIAEKMGKKAVIAADSPGFIVNRVARPFYLEGLKILEEGVAEVPVIDALMEASGFKMGPFRLMDLIGVDSNHYTSTSMFHSFYQEPRFRPSRIQGQLVAAGHHGKKAGKGFYDYT